VRYGPLRRIAFELSLRRSSRVPRNVPSRANGTVRNLWGTMPYNLAEAAAAVGRSKSSILRAIRKGALSARRNDTTGEWAIEPAELFRAYPPVAQSSAETSEGTARHDGETIALRAKLGAAELRITDKDATIDDLRRRLDVATAQLGEALSQVRLLTDQRPARRRWCAGETRRTRESARGLPKRTGNRLQAIQRA
jgi:hypothetical protein